MAATAGSDPDREDYGFADEDFEDPKKSLGTRMYDEHNEYKGLQARSDLLAKGYKEQLGRVPRPPKINLQTEDYVGNPKAIRRHHRELYDHAWSAADAAQA